MKCLEKGEICKTNLKCKVCKLTDCRNTLKAIEEEQEMYFKSREQKFKEALEKEYPQCALDKKICSHLQIINMNGGKVRCPYMINKRCVIK